MSTVKNSKTLKLVQMSILTAIIIIMAFTPLGYLKIGVVEISFLAIPVVIGAILCGPLCGGILGGIFGITSFIQCFGISPFGTALCEINPIYTFIICLVPRILIGVFAGLLFKALYKIDKTKLLSFGAASLTGALTNTVFFVALLLLLFSKSDYISGMMGGMNFLAFAVAFVGINGLIEAGVCLVIGSAVTKALARFITADSK